MPLFYLRAVAESGLKKKLAVVCYQPVIEGKPTGNFTALFADEWGEKEILRRLKHLGLFDLGEVFVPVGPDLKEDLSLLCERAEVLGVTDWDTAAARDFLSTKLLQAGKQCPAQPLEGERYQASLGESNKAMLMRLRHESELFFSTRPAGKAVGG